MLPRRAQEKESFTIFLSLVISRRMNEVFDVAIIGGGPAGSTAGTLLAKEGRSVLILEKEKFPRFHIGESMLPASSDTLQRMGVKEKIDRAGFIVKQGAEIVPACGTKRVRFYFRNGLKARWPTSYHVLRSEFDKLLLDHAKETGCDVRENTKVVSIRSGEEDVSLSIEGQSETIRAKYLIDCSGRNRVVGTQYQLNRLYPKLQKFSLFAHFEDVDQPKGDDGTLTRMVRGTDRWFWMIPLSATKVSVGVVMDTAKFKSLRLSPEQALERAIQEQPMVNEWMKRARRVTQVYAAGDYSYRNTKLVDNRWLLAGDAAGFIDPVFSSGVYLALLSGEQAALALNKAFAGITTREKAFRYYEKRINRVFDLYLNWVLSWYTQEFVEVLLHPQEILELVPTVNAILAGNEAHSFAIKWRLWIFRALVSLQKRLSMIAPRLTLRPNIS
jgi:FADH2-dependent halogenase